VELEDSLDRITETGLGVVAISYDSVEIIRHFADRMGGFRYTLLADPESKIIDAFGIRNRYVEEGHAWFGVPYPGTYIVDENGVVKEKFFDKSYRQRTTADTILLKTFGIDGEPRIEGKLPQFNFTAYTSERQVYPGNHFAVLVDIELPEKMHLYAPGSESYRAVNLRLDPHPMLKEGALELPRPEKLFLPVIDETVAVYTGRVRIFRELAVSPAFKGSGIQVDTILSYQTCDDKICYPPSELPLSFKLDVLENDKQRVPEQLQY